MSVRRVATSVLVLSACTSADEPVLGPFTGETHRFTVDRFELPRVNDDVRASSSNVDGRASTDNALGAAVMTLGQYGGDAQEHVAELIASGALASTIEIQADDLSDDPSVGVTFYGRDGAAARTIGGRIEGGVFLPNRIGADTDGSFAGKGVLALPAFADADPIELGAVALEIELVPDATGYRVRLAGAVRAAEVLEQARTAITAQLLNHPEDHRSLWTIADRNLDGTITSDEMTTSLLATILSADLELPIDGATEKVMSFGFDLHAAPCAAGSCQGAPVTATCFDRRQNGDETDVDCGGSCALACAGERACDRDEDCQSRTCVAGACAAVSCTDGVKNGLEASLDCGGACATKCAAVAVCGYGFDCASGVCTATTSTGSCR